MKTQRASANLHLAGTFAVTALLAIGCGADPGAADGAAGQPTGRGGGLFTSQQIQRPRIGSGPGNGIYYHGGPLIAAGVNVYYIWYGAWGSDTAQAILPQFIGALGGSPYFDINTTYYQVDASGARAYVVNAVAFPAQTSVPPSDPYYRGTALSDGDVAAVVADLIGSGRLPSDPAASYMLLAAPEVVETSGFCTSYCAWHDHTVIAGVDIKYAFVGDPEIQCPGACEAQTATSPNGDPGADAMASAIAHELEETVTDPDFTGWYDRRGAENADKCAWHFGATYVTANGSRANMQLGGQDYLIQENWVDASGGYCALRL